MLLAAEENRFRPLAANQHNDRFRLGKAGQVPEIAVEAVGMVRVAVADDFRRCRHNGNAVADGFQQAFAAGEKVGVGHAALNNS